MHVDLLTNLAYDVADATVRAVEKVLGLFTALLLTPQVGTHSWRENRPVDVGFSFLLPSRVDVPTIILLPTG